MAVRIGKIDLVGLSRISTEDTRSLVKQRGPGQAGGLFQDLGREPVTIVLEGILLGEDTQAALEELRQAHANAKPMSFAADAIAGADLTHVLVADLQLRQLAGHVNRFAFFLRVREYTEPPEAADAGAAKVDAAAKADAAAWQQGAVDAAAVKQDPGLLMTAIDENPALVAHLDGNELGAIAGANADALSGNDFGQLLGTVSEMNPAALPGMVDSLKKQGALGGLLDKLSAAGVKVLDFLKRIKLDTIISLIKMIAGGADFIAKLKAVGEKAKAVGDKLGAINFQNELDQLQKAWDGPPKTFEGDMYVAYENTYLIPDKDGSMRWAWEVDMKTLDAYLAKALAEAPPEPPGNSTISEIIGAIADLIGAIDELLKTDTFKELVKVVKDLQLESIVIPIFNVICTVLTKVIVWLGTLERLAALPRITAILMLHLDDIERMTDMSRPERRQQMQDLGWGELVPISEATSTVVGYFNKLGRVSNALTGKDAVEKKINQLGKNLTSLNKTFADYNKQLSAPTPGATSSTTPALPTNTSSVAGALPQ